MQLVSSFLGLAWVGNSALMLLVFGAHGASALCQFKGIGTRLRPGLPQASPPIPG